MPSRMQPPRRADPAPRHRPRAGGNGGVRGNAGGGGVRAQRCRVALLIETSNRYGRDLLYGVRDWMQAKDRWVIRFTEQARLAPLPGWLAQWEGDGIIARVDSPEIAAALRRTGLPVVDVSAERFASEFPRVSVNNAAVSRLAAEHLLAKGFRHFAFCGDPQFLWARQRGEEFRRVLRSAGHDCAFSEEKRTGARPPGSDAAIRLMADWLETLPRPLGVFACYDGKAQQVLEACQLRDWAVPDDIAVLGVDNDEVLCDLCTPPLSSVQPNARRTGFEAAAMLARMMHGERLTSQTRFVDPVRVVERQSTDSVCIDDARVAQALRFIREHVGERIDVSDVLRAVPMSRTLLELKFKAALGHSPHREIVRQRIARARHLLLESEVSIAVVAELAGFDNASYLSVAFRRETGESPYAFRAKHRTSPARAG